MNLKQVLLKDPPPDPRLAEIREVCRKLDMANQRFSMEQDPDLIEACIYEQESLRARYRYLLRVAREESLKGSPIHDTRNDTIQNTG